MPNQEAMQTITVEELKSRIDQGENVHLLDVRESFEHDEFNIGGLLIPLGQIQTMQTDAIEAWKAEELVCYCRSGNRSGQACQILEMLGFLNVKNLSGGMLAWKEKIDRVL
jgi:rhodanese-related sulfurtransferase